VTVVHLVELNIFQDVSIYRADSNYLQSRMICHILSLCSDSIVKFNLRFDASSFPCRCFCHFDLQITRPVSVHIYLVFAESLGELIFFFDELLNLGSESDVC